MKVRASWIARGRHWRLWDITNRRIAGYATTILLRDATFCPSGNIVGGLEAVNSACGTSCGAAVHWYEWEHAARANNAYRAAAGRLGTFVHHNGDAFTTEAAPMVLLTVTKGGRDKRKAAILAFDPCDMTEAESRAATQ